MGRPARLSARPASDLGRRRAWLARRAGTLGIDDAGRAGRDRQRAVRQPAALHLPRVLPPGLQGEREGVAAHYPRPRRTRTRRRDSATVIITGCSGSTRAPAGRRCRLLRRRRRSIANGQERAVAIAGYSIETPRLLLNSACPEFPDDLIANDFDLVGRYVMVQGAPQTAGRYQEEVREPTKRRRPRCPRTVLRDRGSEQGLQARLLDPEGRCRCRSRSQSAHHSPGPLG